MSTGRKKDNIWVYFKQLPKATGQKCAKVVCIKCKQECQGLVKRMKVHYSQCQSNSVVIEQVFFDDSDKDDLQAELEEVVSNIPLQSTSTEQMKYKRSSMDKYVFKTTQLEKEALDIQCGRFIFATNSPFRLANNTEFQKFCDMLRPGYKPPDRHVIGCKILNEVYEKELSNCQQQLQGEIVCLSIDGWENISNEPIICACVTKDDGTVFLVDTLDTSGMQHTAENLLKVTERVIQQTTEKFNCRIRSFVTDNAANMVNMRQKLEMKLDGETICYGCSAHALNLLAKDITKSLNFDNVQQHVIQIIKYFKRRHLPKAWFHEAGGKSLSLPIDVRWNSYCDSLESYLINWSALAKVCEDKRNDPNFDKDIANKVIDVNMKRLAEDIVALLKPITLALDKMQSNTCKLADAVDIWKGLEPYLTGNETVKTLYQKRYNKTLTNAHFAAYLLSPKPKKSVITTDEREKAMDFIELNFSINFINTTFMKFIAKLNPFRDSHFKNCEQLTDFEWWVSMQSLYPNIISSNNLDLIGQLHTAISSSAGIERIFSKFGLTHTALRNKLGTNKAAKLVFVSQQLIKIGFVGSCTH